MALALLIAYVFLLVCFWPLRILRTYLGLVSLFVGWIVLYLYAVFSAHGAKHPGIQSRLSRWWLFLFLPLTFVTLSLIGRGITRVSGFRSFSIPSTSMEKTLAPGDNIVVDTWYYQTHGMNRKDVVVFQKAGTYFVKRVIGLEGDSVMGHDETVAVNGQPLNETYIQHTGSPPIWMNNFGPAKIPHGKCFVMGDNRDVSLDSRSAEFGLVDVEWVIGKPLYIFQSNRVGHDVH